MSTDPRAALAMFVAALERHLEASASPHRDDDPVVLAAYHHIATTFEAYEDALGQAYDEETPLGIYSDDDDDDDYDDIDDDLDDDIDDLYDLDDTDDSDDSTSDTHR